MQSLQDRVNSLPWHHQIDFGQNVLSPGTTAIDVLRRQADVYFKYGVADMSVIDIGCWDGYNSFEADARGARRVLATDHFAWSDRCWGDRASFELARAHLAPEVEVLDIDLPDISVESVGSFDVVLFLGVLYHLRHPLAELERVSGICERLIVIESHLDALDVERPAMIFYPTDELASDPTNWWGPNPVCIEAMLHDCGFTRIEYTQHPVYGNRGIFHGSR